MSDYRTLDRIISAKIETTRGTDSAPTVGADAILVEGPSWTGGIEALNTNEVTGSLDARAPVPGGGSRSFAGTVNLKGSGSEGTAPEYNTFLRGSGLAETLTGAAVTGTAAAGAAGSITLAVAASTTVDFYKGMVISITGGTGAGQQRVISAYSAGRVASVHPNWTVTPDGTSVYRIHPNALYVPASSALPSLSLYDHQRNRDRTVNARLRKLVGAMGNCDFTLPPRGIPQAAFTFMGQFVTPTDVADPGNATYDAQRPVAFQKADISLGGAATKFSSLTFTLGNTVAPVDDPSADFGYGPADLTRRAITGRINPPLTLLSARDVWADFLAGTERALWVRYGQTAGNRLSFFFPRLIYTGQEEEDVNGYHHEGIPFAAQGEDAGLYICVH